MKQRAALLAGVGKTARVAHAGAGTLEARCARVQLALVILALVLIPLSAPTALAQGATAVATFTPGSGQSTGQEPEYFPSNVLGLPDTAARRHAASVDPSRILSLGLGGEIVLRFDDAPIVDGPGPDFIVFENAFAYTIGPRERIYAEPGIVAVSRDGATFHSFPYDPRTLAGCAGVTPTNGDRSPIDPRVSGGDAFDLAALGIDSVRYVRVTDITAMVAGDPGHPFWDPTLSGFDLDAVVAIPIETRSALSVGRSVADSPIAVAPNPARDRVRVTSSAGADLMLVDALGRVVLRERASGPAHTLDCSAMSPGTYSLIVEHPDGERGVSPLVIVR